MNIYSVGSVNECQIQRTISIRRPSLCSDLVWFFERIPKYNYFHRFDHRNRIHSCTVLYNCISVIDMDLLKFFPNIGHQFGGLHLVNNKLCSCYCLKKWINVLGWIFHKKRFFLQVFPSDPHTSCPGGAQLHEQPKVHCINAARTIPITKKLFIFV